MFEKTFCSSPWFHIQLTYEGNYRSCRWSKHGNYEESIRTHSLLEFYNSNTMCNLRKQILEGQKIDHCSPCYYEEEHNKLNGRQRQLLKSAISVNEFPLTFRSSPHFNNFEFSYKNNGKANLLPVDLQIDLGNTCNSACIMCHPRASSRLQTEYKKLNQIQPEIFKITEDFTPWTKDPLLLKKFVNDLLEIKHLKYIHFLGGETLYEESFYTICESLINNGLSKDLIIGTTTNGTIYNERIEKLVPHFKGFHLGISLDSVTELNDYIRYPSKINNILQNIDKFLKLRDSIPGLYVSIRITPTVFTVFEIDKLFVYLIENKVIAESCNILYEPDYLRIELIPDEIRNQIIEKLENLIDYYELKSSTVVNVRRDDLIAPVTANVILEYYNFFKNYESPGDVNKLRYKLVNSIKTFESIRNNSILTHLPEYEKFLRSFGY